MGKSILTAHQSDFLEQAGKCREITDRYYFTGGTALAEVYLSHRLSEDLDFFTFHDVNYQDLKSFFTAVKDHLGITSIRTSEHYNMIFYFLCFGDGSELKVDFVSMPYRQVESGIRWRNFDVDSVFDIALNKLYTMSDRARARDFVDLYLILVTQGISFEQVVARLNDKFDPFVFNDMTELASKITRVKDISGTEYPEMLVPFDRKVMIDFYLAEARKLGEKIFR